MRQVLRDLFAVVVLAAASLAASQAAALSSLDIEWSDGYGSGTGSSITNAAPSSTITAWVVLRGDSVGITGVYVSILFDTAELDVIQAQDSAGYLSRHSSKASFYSYSPGVTIDEAAGEILGFDSRTSYDVFPCRGCTITLGSVVFHAASPSGDASDIDVQLAVLPGGLDGFEYPEDPYLGPAPVLGGAAVVPEPNAGLLVVVGLVALVSSVRRRS